ncbi:hypothetical protein [Bacillus sp. FJAT-45350]|uniref:hypothetical protein n=1 Tax=Bacillus sp. FJAT-45350 TaxID=2011014 RepID=UPI000BB981E3|nr:hypothetical protein [Bacillus sp. FJAT-45350]
MDNKLYKAYFLHPYTNVPLVVSYNKTRGILSFEKDEEMIGFLLSIKDKLKEGDSLVDNIKQTDHITKFTYPAETLDEVYDFLEKLGVEREAVNFETVLLN